MGVSSGSTVGTLEDRFRWDGEQAHEFVILREAEFADGGLDERERFEEVDPGGSVEPEATWERLEKVAAPRGRFTRADSSGSFGGDEARVTGTSSSRDDAGSGRDRRRDRYEAAGPSAPPGLSPWRV